MSQRSPRPPQQYLSAEYVLGEMCDFGEHRLEQLSVPQVLVLATIGGGFITMGALFSVLLADGITAEGPKRLIEVVGFSAGFFFVGSPRPRSLPRQTWCCRQLCSTEIRELS